MTHFELRIPVQEASTRPDKARDIQLWISRVPAGKRTPVWELSHTYTAHEQYPLGADRFATNRRNLFLDVLSLLDAGARVEDASDAVRVSEIPEPGEEHTDEQAQDYTVATLKTLAQRAARVAADGSGNARRFKDARALWQKLSAHVDAALKAGLTEPVTNVRKTHNWKKNQPFKDVSAHPDAWYVLNVYARSNPKKDAFLAVRTLGELWAYVAERDAQDAATLSRVEQQRAAAEANLDYPTFGELAQLTGDANMLVFPDDASLVSWIRETAGSADELARETPVEAHVPPSVLDEDDPAYMPRVSTGTALHLANVLDK
ncbi:hypothetical protein [Alloscardovia macacae]|uniref:Uncharacterized protein n=1 Tax=Alloscardovia macacae TaxID=1160091 RepID=A0A261F862_9BIFI|nr:hypothetical protein [Alloscardovia macacae]OZG55066.1 hypothetical protein ALMA_0391 [Alloscardovia macacae]